MKKLFYVLTLILLCLTTVSCISLRTHMIDEYIPPLLDETTLLPYTNYITITNESTGETIKFTSTSDINNISLQLGGIECSRHNKTNDLSPLFTVTFYTKNENVTVEICSPTAFNIGKYRFSSIAHKLDLSYIASLFE